MPNDRKKILVVEDEPHMRSLLTLRLETSGYEVSQVADGEHGLKAVKSALPDLIILDVMLPGIGGYEVCSRLKSDKNFSHIPIIMFTARAGDMDRAMGFQCGVNEYMAKPFDGDTLVNKIEKLLLDKTADSGN